MTLALFDFIVAYEEPGYLIKTIEKSFSPLTIDMVKDYSEVALLMSFITYSYGNNLEPELRKRYFEAENKRQQEKENKLIEKIKNIRKKIEQEGKTLDEYLQNIATSIAQMSADYIINKIKTDENFSMEKLSRNEIVRSIQYQQKYPFVDLMVLSVENYKIPDYKAYMNYKNDFVIPEVTTQESTNE